MDKSRMIAAVDMEWNEEKGVWIATARHECYEKGECVQSLQRSYEIELCDDTVAISALMELMEYEVCDLSEAHDNINEIDVPIFEEWG